MGLDMYLNKKTYVGACYEHRNVQADIKIKVGEKELAIDPKKISEVIEQVGYWRKANAIHAWFVDNTQDGEDRNGSSYVSKEQLKELLDLCKKVKEVAVLVPGKLHAGTTYSGGQQTENYEDDMVIQNEDEVAELLPSRGGFFFGSTEYNQWYMDDIDKTIQILEALDLSEVNPDQTYEYCASW